MAINRLKRQTTVGIEFSENGVRAARVSVDAKSGLSMGGVEEVTGNMTKEEDLVKALNTIKTKLNISKKDYIVTCLTGKQIHAAQIKFKDIPDAQMENALKLHIRKSITFEVAGAALSYDRLADLLPKTKLPAEPENGEAKKEKTGDIPLIVSAAANSLLNRHLKLFIKAGIKQDDVQIFPVIVANALQARLSQKTLDVPNVVLYFGKNVVSLVIDGPKHQFFHRNIYFSADQVLAQSAEKTNEREKERKLRALGDEISRSLVYYESNFHGGGVGEIFAFGQYCEVPEIRNIIQKATNVEFKLLSLYKSNKEKIKDSHKYSLAIALALTGMEPMRNVPRLYRLNLIKKRRQAEMKDEGRKLVEFIFQMACYGILVISILFSLFKVMTMHNTISAEEEKLHRLKQEYQKYTATKIFVNKSDIERLDSLQRDRIFWTNKLASLAFHLPENYWINRFTFKRDNLNVNGYGYITPKQEQLITVDDYLNAMRTDSMFNDVFKTVYFDRTERSDEKIGKGKGAPERKRVSFEFTAARPGKAPAGIRKTRKRR